MIKLLLAITGINYHLILPGKLHFAIRIYERMLSLNISPSIQTYNTMIRLEIDFNSLRCVSPFRTNYQNRFLLFINVIGFHDIVNCSVHGRGRNLDKAVDIFNRAQAMGVALDEKIYTNMICHYGKAGRTLFLRLVFHSPL